MFVLNHTVMQSTRTILFTQMVMHTVSVGNVTLPKLQALLSPLNCSGSEKRLVDCDHDGVGVAPTSCLRVTVRCRNNETEAEEGMYDCTIIHYSNFICSSLVPRLFPSSVYYCVIFDPYKIITLWVSQRSCNNEESLGIRLAVRR